MGLPSHLRIVWIAEPLSFALSYDGWCRVHAADTAVAIMTEQGGAAIRVRRNEEAGGGAFSAPTKPSVSSLNREQPQPGFRPPLLTEDFRTTLHRITLQESEDAAARESHP